MSTLNLHARLKSLSDAQRAVSSLIARLARLASSPSGTATPQQQQPQQPQPPPPSDDDDPARAELAAEIQAGLKELEQEFELVRQDAEDATAGGTAPAWGAAGRGHRRRDSERDHERVAIATQVERVGEDLKLARTEFHKAQLAAARAAKQRSAARAKREREALLSSATAPAAARDARRPRDPKQSGAELALSASSDVTAALRRTHQLMRSELERSQFAHETLQRSTAALTSLNESYSSLDSLLASSKSLVGTLVRSQKSDTWYLETAFWLLVATVGWLFFRRIVYGPVRYLLYIPGRAFLRLLVSVLQIFLSLVVGSEAASSSPARSLTVKPSATGRGPTRNPNMPAPSMRAGQGGAGAKRTPDDPKVEEIGRMAEETKQKERFRQAEKEEAEQQEAEGDDEEEAREEDEAAQEEETELRDRAADEPPNPKKRMWEEPPPTEGERVRDEL